MADKINYSFKKNTLRYIEQIKNEKLTDIPVIIPLYYNKKFKGFLRPVSISSLEDKDEIARLSKWRMQSQKYFPAQFRVTNIGTRKWLDEKLLNTKDRLLFIITTPSGKPIGHVGLFRFNFDKFTCEIDNIIRGEKDIKGIMTIAIGSLIYWSREYLNVKNFTLEVFSDNEKAIHLYKRCGFKIFKKIPLKKMSELGRISWIEDETLIFPERYNLYMNHKENE